MGPDLAEISQFLDTQVSLAPTHVSWLVRWSHFRISNLWSVTVDQIKKVQKTKCIYFRILFLGGPSSPTKMYMKAEMLENVYEGLNAQKCKGRSNQKIKKTKP